MYARSYYDSAINWASIQKDYPNVKIRTFPKDIIKMMKKENVKLLNEAAKKDPLFKEILDSQQTFMKKAREWTSISDYSYLQDNIK